MSDFERIELTPTQFAKWNELAQTQINALWRIAEVITNLKNQQLEQKVDHLIELLESGTHIPDLGFINAKLDLILGMLESGDQAKIDELALQLNQDADEMQQALNRLNQPKQSEEK